MRTMVSHIGWAGTPLAVRPLMELLVDIVIAVVVMGAVLIRASDVGDRHLSSV
jgi:hypothetical protein